MPNSDVQVLRELARQYVDAAARPIQQERRELWSAHFGRRPTRPPILASYGMWNVWCRQTFGDAQMRCEDPFFRAHERNLRMSLFHDAIDDDFILEPWINLNAARPARCGPWGVAVRHVDSEMEGGAWKFDPVICDWSDVSKLRPPPHEIDEEATDCATSMLHDAIGDLLPVNVQRGPSCQGFRQDISNDLCQLRGLEQVMLDMCESPRELHNLLAVMRDGILANHAMAEAAGDWGLTEQTNQAMPYADELPRPQPNVRGCKRSQLWGFFAAQELTGVSPAMHDEFMLQYQLPIAHHFGLVHYGCCEDLTRKIDMLRQIPNLRSIAVTPRADVRRCAEQIGADYIISWRPNPADMVCCGFNEQRIAAILREGLAACRGCHVHIHLKDIETLEGQTDRLARWAGIARQVIEEMA